ncbi:MAG TPA: alpha-L-rhamnosidase C-terminal domain-containing protein [Terriglobales bacterium]|nr:alpha-L-rhamnosidase C-terminal domain-containing protein [Terriglobales bacterium]
MKRIDRRRFIANSEGLGETVQGNHRFARRDAVANILSIRTRRESRVPTVRLGVTQSMIKKSSRKTRTQMLKAKFLVCALLSLLFTTSAPAQPAAEAQGLWHAQWITSASAPQRDAVVLRFRKVLDLSQVPQHFVVHVSADTQFILSVNQKEVGRGPALGDLAHWRYETYDLASFLHDGENMIAATVWNFGTLTPLAQISDRTAFVMGGDNEASRAVDTDKSWEVEVDKGIDALPAPSAMENYYYAAEPGERIDGTAFDWSWNEAHSHNGKWDKAASIGNAIERGAVLQNINWQLTPDLLPPMEMDATPIGRVVRTTGIQVPPDFPDYQIEIPAHSNVTILLDESHLTTAYPELTVSGGARSTVRLTYAEALMDDKGEKGNRNEVAGKHIVGIVDEFLPDGSASRQFMPLAWRTWRYLQLDINTDDQPLRIDSLRSWFTAYPFDERAHFETDDTSLAQIWQIGWRTARLDAHSTYMDTPYWERMQYIGDTRIQALISYVVAGDDRLPRQAIQAFNDSRIPDGITRSRYPSSVTQIIPTFSLLWIGMVHDFWMYRGDADFVKAQLSGTRTVLNWFLAKQRPDGLIGNLPWWPFVDWGKDFSFGVPPQDPDGGSSIITLQFVEALRNAAAFESALGNKARAQEYSEAEVRAVNAIRRLCWNERYHLLADTPAQKHYSQHANILGVWLDVIPQDQQKEVLNNILSASDPRFTASRQLPEMTTATYYFRFYLARAVEHAGMGDQYLNLLKPWHDMIALGLTTWAEQPEPTRSDSHAWSAHPNYDFLTIVAGIHPKTPGFSTIVIQPHLGSLRHLASSMPTPKGAVEADYTVEGSGMRAEIDLPATVTGDLMWKGKTLRLHAGHQQLLLP